MSNGASLIKSGLKLETVICLPKGTRCAEFFLKFYATHDVSKLTFACSDEKSRILIKLKDLRFDNRVKNSEAMRFVVDYINEELRKEATNDTGK